MNYFRFIEYLTKKRQSIAGAYMTLRPRINLMFCDIYIFNKNLIAEMSNINYLEYRLISDIDNVCTVDLEIDEISNSYYTSPFFSLITYAPADTPGRRCQNHSRWRISEVLYDTNNESRVEDYKNKMRQFLEKIQIGSSSLEINSPSFEELIFKINQYFGFYVEDYRYNDDNHVYGMYNKTIALDSTKEITFTFHLDQYHFEYYKNYTDVYMGFADCRVVIDETQENILFRVQVFSIDGLTAFHKRVNGKMSNPFLLFHPVFNKKVIKERIRDTFSYFKASSVEELKLKISNFSNLSISDDILSQPLGNRFIEHGKVFKFKEVE